MSWLYGVDAPIYKAFDLFSEALLWPTLCLSVLKITWRSGEFSMMLFSAKFYLNFMRCTSGERGLTLRAIALLSWTPAEIIVLTFELPLEFVSEISLTPAFKRDYFCYLIEIVLDRLFSFVPRFTFYT